jgi:hypothetical protein
MISDWAEIKDKLSKYTPAQIAEFKSVFDKATKERKSSKTIMFMLQTKYEMSLTDAAVLVKAYNVYLF